MPSLLVFAGQRGKLVVISDDPVIEARPLFAEILQQPYHPRTDWQFPSHELVEPMSQRGSTFRQDHAPLEQHRAQLIGQPGPRRDQSLAGPVQHLQIASLLGAKLGQIEIAVTSEPNLLPSFRTSQSPCRSLTEG
ncbi:MAG TPA: hypothetical protein VFL55_00720 [Acetobacteraceae bacterium]|nr:hypothetical protein [Acetobacteraceae bacterium]